MRYFILAAVLVLALLAAGCTTTAGLPPSMSVTLNDIRPYSTTNPYLQPDAGYRFLAVDFSVENTGLTTYEFNPLDATLRDGDMISYRYATVSSTVPGFFGMTEIPPGETRRGKLVFAVPKKWGDSTNYVLTITP